MGFNPQMTAKQNIYVNASLLADKGGGVFKDLWKLYKIKPQEVVSLKGVGHRE